ncbi:MAG: type II toxin-antitoxin system VapC family toxin [bacterium]|nr:type II toxin-antitoxin system VapC family toxin [bacterium]
MIVADSDVLIDALRGKEPSASRVAQELRKGSLATTSINSFELLSGARADADRVRVEQLLAPLSILPCDESAGALAAEIRRHLEAAGTKIGMADYLIAGICITRSALLLTRNRRHFERVPGLRFEDLTPA